MAAPGAATPQSLQKKRWTCLTRCYSKEQVNNTTVKIIQVRSRKTTTIQLNHRTQIRRNNWQDIENHPFWFIPRIFERFKYFHTFNNFNNFLS